MAHHTFVFGSFITNLQTRQPGLIYDCADINHRTRHVHKVQERSRGRHEPGSGPYTNRIAIGGECHGTGAQSAYFTHCCKYFRDQEAEIQNPERSRTLHRWDGTRSTSVWIYPPKTEWWVSEPMKHWRVEWSTCRIDWDSLWVVPAGWGVKYTRIYSDRYASNSHYGDFGDNEQAAIAYAYGLLSDPTGHGKYPDAFKEEQTSADWYDLNELVFVPPRLSPRFEYWGESIDILPHLSLDAGIANAYVDACSKLPHTQGMNNIANVVQTISTIKDLLQGRLTELGTLADAWLAYRYEYTTTKLDIEEAVDLVDRLHEITTKGIQHLRSNGYYKSDNHIFRCSIVAPAEMLKEAQSLSERWGIQLSAYNVWDLIPYSFIVDWFLSVGDILERWEAQSYAMRITPEACWCSVQTSGQNEFECYEIDYHRWYGTPDVSAADLDWISHGPSGTTVVKRAADIFCLLQGK